eukprot:CAMPEP_0182418184 /NCGR_PEP_ID=MMETSP1167-20130531/2653_1 /TAXON_ID=2988 /ORGANISM="Mallomonas Sp, Strain CCMP3275" /LENGTH=406 /DNA_ID=CAMNT_0024592243 /DNA_START=381 /DNA_END=1601 /DNA_ORIENTATION=-
MDSWNEKQIKLMKAGGNDNFCRFLNDYGIKKDLSIPQKYNTAAAAYYKDRLLAMVEGRPLPKEPSRSELMVVPSSNQQAGSDPLPGESESDYVARQRLLQEQARERLKAKFGNSTGLSSKGSMQGIGSDPSYKAGSSAATGIDVNSLLSTSMSTLKVLTEATTELASKAVTTVQDNKFVKSDTTSGGSGGGGGWGFLATGAVDLWQKAQSTTSELLAPPSEDELRFPRPDGFPRPNTVSSSSSSTPSSSTSTSISTGKGGYDNYKTSPVVTTRKSSSSSVKKKSTVEEHTWDDFDDDEPAPAVKPKSRPSPALATRKKTNNSSSGQLSVSSIDSSPPPPPANSPAVLSPSSLPPRPPSTKSSLTNTPTTSSVGGGGKGGKGGKSSSSKKAMSPQEEEDFFAAFGMK